MIDDENEHQDDFSSDPEDFGDDDFAFDDDIGGEDEFFEDEYLEDEYAESWEDEQGSAEESQQDMQDSPPPKKSNKRVFLAIVLAVVMGGGYLVVSGGGAPPSAPVPKQTPESQGAPAQQANNNSARTQSPQKVPDKSQQVVQQESQDPVPEQKGFLNDENQLREVERIRDKFVFEDVVDDPLPAEPDIENEVLDPAQNDPGVAGPLIPVIGDDVEEIKTAGVPSAEDVKIKQPEDGNSDIKTDQEALAMPVDNLAVSGRLEERLGQLIGRLDSIETRLASIENASNANHMDAMEERILALHTRIDKVVAQVERAPTMAKDAAGEKDSAAPVESPVNNVESSHVKNINSPKPDKKPAIVKADQSFGAAKQSVVWALKSAQPGRALVSRNNDSDIRAVKEGDALEGIGVILEIANHDGVWVVTGDSGTIVQ